MAPNVILDSLIIQTFIDKIQKLDAFERALKF